MVTITNYRLDETRQSGFLYVLSYESSTCPICREHLIVRETRQRVCWLRDEAREILIIRRLYCEKCNSIHHELPDCLVPYKRYSAEVIEGVVSGKPNKECGCTDNAARKLRRWWAAVLPYFMSILSTLSEKFGVNFGKPPAFKEMVRATANSNNWIFAHQLFTRSEAHRE